MKIWRDGDESREICPTCERRTDVVFQRRPLELEDPDVEVPDVLVAVCRECDGIAIIPHQETSKIGKAIDLALTTNVPQKPSGENEEAGKKGNARTDQSTGQSGEQIPSTDTFEEIFSGNAKAARKNLDRFAPRN